MSNIRVADIDRFHWQRPVKNVLNTPPGTPVKGDRHIVGGVPTGAWETHENKIAEYTGSQWIFITPLEWYTTLVESEEEWYVYYGGAWVLFSNFLTAQSAIEDYWHNNASAGRLFGGVITVSATPGRVNISAGAGLIKTESGGTVDQIPIGECCAGQGSRIEFVEWDALDDFELSGVGYNLIYWDASEGIMTSALKEDFYDEFDFVRDFTIGRVFLDGDEVVTARLCGMNFWNFDRRVQMFGEERFPVERAFGLNIGNVSPASKQFTITDGVIWAELVNRFTITGFNTVSPYGESFTYWWRSAIAGEWSKEAATEINDQQYDNGSGTRQTLTSNRYAVAWIFIDHVSGVHAVMGQGDYTLAQALDAGVPASLPGLVAAYSTIVGKIIIQRNASTFYSIESPFTTQFTAAGVTQHNELSGLQGGGTNEYYHLTAAKYNELQSQPRGIVVTSVNYTVQAGDYIVRVQGGGVTITLPLIDTYLGRELWIIDDDGAATDLSPIIIEAEVDETIDTLQSVTIESSRGSILLSAVETDEWRILMRKE
jgi:hypothetical protein